MAKNGDKVGSKYYILLFSHFKNYFRFGTSIRKEGKPKTTYYEREKVYTKLEAPGPGGHDIKSYTDAGVKVLLQKRLTETEL